MADCGYDTSKFVGSSPSYNGTIAPGNPPPVVKIKEDISDGSCGFGGNKIISIDISGELLCCDPSTTISDAEALREQFSAPCGNFSGGGYSYSGARVTSFELGASNFLGNVPYSASLTWTDPSYPPGDSGVMDPTNTIQASLSEGNATITHTVSAKSAPSTECDDCGCDISKAKSFVDSNISADSSPPTPKTFTIPNNPEATGSDCPEVTIEEDVENCFYSSTKTWTINANINLTKSSYGNNVKVTKCRESQYDQNQKETIIISGSISWMDSAKCDDDCKGRAKQITDALEAEVSAALASVNGRKANVSKNWTESSSPSASYTVTFPPEPDDSDQDVKDSNSISISFGSDGVGTVTVSGSMSANTNKHKTLSEKCLCDVVDGAFGNSKDYFGKASQYYNSVKGAVAAAMKKIQGPCFEDNTLNNEPESEDEKDCEAGSKSYSYTWTDKPEKDAQWNFSVNVGRPIEKVSIQNTIGGGYCVTRSGQFDYGSVSVNGSRSQNCPNDANFDTDGIALQIATAYTGGGQLTKDSDCTETKNVTGGEAEKSNFNSNWKYENGGGANAANINPKNNNNNRKNF